MRNVIIRMAIMYPHKYPWEKQLQRELEYFNIDQVNSILQEENISEMNVRRFIGWELERLIYNNAIYSNSVQELTDKVMNEFGKIECEFKSLPRETVEKVIARKDLGTNDKLTFYKSFLLGRYTKAEYMSSMNWIYLWLTDIIASYHITKRVNPCINKHLLTNAVYENLKNIFYEDNFSSERVTRVLERAGYFNNSILELYNEKLHKYNANYIELLKNLFTLEESKATENKVSSIDINEIGEALLGMVEKAQENDITNNNALCNKEKKRKNKKQIQSENNPPYNCDGENEIDEESINNKELLRSYEAIINKTIENLKALSKDIGYELIQKEEYQNMKDMIDSLKENEKKQATIDKAQVLMLLRKLVNPSEGAVLSELYNTYLSIDKTNILNLKAALGDFFNFLLNIGLSVNEIAGQLGDVVEVEEKELLTKYILLRPANFEGTITGEIKYLGWNYDNKLLIPPVVKPIK